MAGAAMTTSVTNHVAEIAVPGQLQITVRAAHGELEIAQEYDGEWHGIYVHPENILRLIGAMLRTAGMDDVELIRCKGGSPHFATYEDVELPDPVPVDAEQQNESAPKDRTAAERQRRHRQRHRNGQERDANRDERDTDRELPLRLPAAE
jgi:hypothetical protein